jgi:YHS domain-containing protein
MKSRLFLSALAVVALLAVHSLRAEDKEPGKDVKCPVSGKAVNPASFVEFGGGKVYFCCDGCPAAFKKDTAKYAAKANLQLAQTGQIVEVACPLTGKPLNPEASVDINGVKVAFCCNGCKGKIAKMTPEEQVDAVFANVSKGYKPADEASK